MKKLLLTIGFILSASLCFASSGPQVWRLEDFSKGQNNQISPLSTPDNQAVEAKNVRFNSTYGSLGKRLPVKSAWDAGASTINGLHRYYKTDGTTKVIIATSTTLEVGSTTDTTTTTIATGLTDGKRFSFATYKDIAIGSNGYDQPLKYDGKTVTTANTDGTRTVGELCAELGAPFAELNTGANLDAASWYQYKVAFYDGSTYDYSTARSNPILTGSTVTDITLTNIPLGPTGTTYRYIYRTLGNSSKANVKADTTFYLVAALSNNTATTYNDQINDGTIDDDAAPTWSTVSGGTNCTPPKGKYLEIAKERLFVSGNVTYLSDIYWSDSLNPDHFLPSDFEVCRPDDGDKITFIKSFLGILTVGKTNTIQKFYTDGDADANWAWSDPFSFIGCPAPYSVSVSPAGIIYAGRNGIYKFNGQTSSLISDAITPDILDISQIDIEECAGIYHNDEYRLAYASSASGSTYNNRVLLYNFIRDSYALDTQNINCFTSFNSGTDSGVLYGGSSSADGYVFAFTSAGSVLSESQLSSLDDGTFNDTRIYNTESSPIIEMAWDCTIDGWLTELQTKSASINTINDIGTYLSDSIIDRPDTSGTWTSPIYEINAATLDKLYWNESLGSYGDLTWQIRLASTSGGIAGASWETAVSNPNGSDLSSITANNFMQLRANFSTTNVNYSPTAYTADGYLFKLAYSRVGADYETAILSVYKTGWKDFGVPLYKKFLKRIKVFYTGTSGTVSINYKNEEGDIDKTFTIDLSISPAFNINDDYTGSGDLKVFTYYPPANSSTDPSPIGQLWQFTITEGGVVNWLIHKIEVVYNVEEADVS